MILSEHRHPFGAQDERLLLDRRATVRPRRERRMMKEQRDVGISASIEPSELCLYSIKLRLVVGNIRVKRYEKRIAESE